MKENYVEFPIYFGDLNEDAQKRLMKLVHIDDPGEANWDPEINTAPIAVYATNLEEWKS